jgi:hypothetical protein
MRNYPVLDTTDTIVISGTFSGIAYALEQARSGHQVILIESRSYLGFEVTATLRPWVEESGVLLSELQQACVDATGLPAVKGEYPLHLDAVKKCLEDILMQAGVKLLYGVNPVERLADGLVVGSKSGLSKIPCTTVMDARASGLAAVLPFSDSTVAITLEFEDASFAEFLSYGTELPAVIDVPAELGMLDNKVYFHRGYRKEDHPYLRTHVLIECRMQLPQIEESPLSQTQRYLAAREKAFSVASYLLWEHPLFRRAYLGRISEALYDEQMEKNTPHVVEPGDLKQRKLEDLSVDVLVIGGGTSGAMSAIAAAHEGADSLVVDMNPGLGGTGTYGGVSMYWMGWQKGYCGLARQWTDEVHDRIRYPHMQGVLGMWNIEAKTQALAQNALDAGVKLLFDTRVIDVTVENGCVVGAVAATPLGIVHLKAGVVIDATGDGDIAAFAGAAFDYGSTRDGSIMWYSLPMFKGPGKITSNFTAMVDLTIPEDYSRAIVWGRRRRGMLYDYGSYLAPRESRRIRGEVTQSLSDQLRRRAYPDVIALAISNNDMKGHTSSDWMNVGLIPPNLQIEISYGMLIPQNLEGLLVVGKAISVERDALPSIRMQPDFENLGAAAGFAAAFAVKEKAGVRDVNLRALQKKLVEVEILPKSVLTRELAPRTYSSEEISRLVHKIVASPVSLREYSGMEVDEVYREEIPFVELCCAGPAAVPIIEQALETVKNRAVRRQLARALALMGASSAVPVLIEEIEQDLQQESLPGLEGIVRHAQPEAPDQAAMPETAYLLNALALSADMRSIPVWEKVVSKLEGVSLKDIFATQSGIFSYVMSVCDGAERLGKTEAIPLLEQLAANSALNGHLLKTNDYPESDFADYLLERAAYLEIAIARALARCASPNGLLTLIHYLADVRTLYRRHAHQELVCIAGKDLGVEPTAWAHWLESASENLQPTPWQEMSEVQTSWQDEILVSKEE